ncbi:hypothetical protein [Phyllobacterium chamaecytisi]|uniref:hypothetical protein n=1 Tax=Phyllobacterium chamaecytisi TaxID=2876082 RepID=UPI001CCE76FA|nr:hypothetical protein [Phyllobacterium sp. KW56]MBZ9600763.1 hypothetical protein [Phyllobacterium sp. KW56]
MANRTLIGDFGSGDYRLRVSKPGFDVTAALDRERLAFDSSWPDAAVVYKTGIINVTSSPVTVPFGETLPTVPFCVVFRVIDANNYMMGQTFNQGPNSFNWMAECTTTYLRFFEFHGGGGYLGGYVILRGPL